jgi:16S rRNA (uracil1498-N3)-methyltransferase
LCRRINQIQKATLGEPSIDHQTGDRTMRVFIPKDMLFSAPPLLEGEPFHHLVRVLRAREGEEAGAVTGDGFIYRVRIGRVSRNCAAFEITGRTPARPEPRLQLHLYLGAPKAGGLEEALPGLAQAGVFAVTPFYPGRSQGAGKPFTGGKRKRLDGIGERAAALSGRGRLTVIRDPLPFRDALKAARNHDACLFFYEEAPAVPLKEVLKPLGLGEMASLGLFIGPEGGFTPEEAEEAGKAGLMPASLGPRVFEARTAPLVAVSAIFYEAGDI